MAKFISVLNSDLGKQFWKAVQWSNSLSEIRSNRFFTAGVNMALPKNEGDAQIEQKELVETVTGKTSQAAVIRLTPETVNAIKLAGNQASAAFVTKISKKLN